MPKYGIAIIHYDRLDTLEEVVWAVHSTAPENTKIVICDDGTDGFGKQICTYPPGPIIIGPNLGVAANKNRGLFALQDCDYICLIEDDLMPTQKGWFEVYVKASELSGIHHFCRVQDKEVEETSLVFKEYMAKSDLTPIYGPSPRGDLTFITREVLSRVGGLNPKFRGVGYAHGEWSNRIADAGLCGHPNKWIDIKEARDCFIQKGDRSGGRWNLSETELQTQLDNNRAILETLKKTPERFVPLTLE